MIEMKNIIYMYEDSLALQNIDCNIAKGEKVALLGSNGSGKSTLLRILAALYFPKKGEYYFENQKVTKKVSEKIRKKIGIIFQNPDSMLFNPTVYDEIAFSLKEFGLNDIEKRVLEVSKQFRLLDLLKKSPLRLSGGEKQKVILASILAYEPELLLLDEPTTAMDPKTTGWFIDFVLDLDKTIVLATHDLNVAYETCQRAIVLDESHTKIYDGDMEELMENMEILIKANLIHKHKHKHKRFIHSHYHLHF